MFTHNKFSTQYAIAYTSISRKLFFNVPEEEVTQLLTGGEVVVVEQHPHVPHITYSKIRHAIKQKVGFPIALKFNPFGDHEWHRVGAH